MTEINNFKRYIPKKVPLCCNIIEGHWTFSVNEHISCICRKRFDGANIEYYFCENNLGLFYDITWRVSVHNKCPKNILLSKRREAIIDEIRCLYNKLRIVEDDLTTDCIRYIILREIDESK